MPLPFLTGTQTYRSVSHSTVLARGFGVGVLAVRLRVWDVSVILRCTRPLMAPIFMGFILLWHIPDYCFYLALPQALQYFSVRISVATHLHVAHLHRRLLFGGSQPRKRNRAFIGAEEKRGRVGGEGQMGRGKSCKVTLIFFFLFFLSLVREVCLLVPSLGEICHSLYSQLSLSPLAFPIPFPLFSPP